MDDIVICMSCEVIEYGNNLWTTIDLLKHFVGLNIMGMHINHEEKVDDELVPPRIRYLNMLLSRHAEKGDNGQRILSTWSFQDYASGRIINVGRLTVLQRRIPSSRRCSEAVTSVWGVIRRNGFRVREMRVIFREVCGDEGLDVNRFVEYSGPDQPSAPVDIALSQEGEYERPDQVHANDAVVTQNAADTITQQTPARNAKKLRIKCVVCKRKMYTWKNETGHQQCLRGVLPSGRIPTQQSHLIEGRRITTVATMVNVNSVTVISF